MTICPPRSVRLSRLLILGIVFLIARFDAASLAADPLPKSLDPRIKIELFAEDPRIATPTGIDVDHAGRVWVIESNTHFPPEGYDRHPTDRVHVLTDTNGDGQADGDVIFTDGLKFTMSVAVRPPWFAEGQGPRAKGQGQNIKADATPSSALGSQPSALGPPLSVYLATRAEIFLFHDDDGDLKADRKESIVRLDTKGDYPHNGLAGIAFDPIGWMYFGFGENLGEPYKIIGSDGTTLSGGGEGGNLYRCRLDGSKLERWATGFWNPHASCFDAFGRLFTVDNDADSRPPCRLLHIIPGGDYGFRFRNGRKGLHPFTAWNGEILGTLPMVAGTGEAPSGILAYESDGLPDEYIGNLLVTSWGDHRIDRFRLKPKGASFESLAEPVIVGDENFRPVGIACAPDGSLFVSDWVLRDYKLHGKGRVWRILGTDSKPKAEIAKVEGSASPAELQRNMNSRKIGTRRMSARTLANAADGRASLAGKMKVRTVDVRARIECYWALVDVASREPRPADLLALDTTQHDYTDKDEVTTAAAWLISEQVASMFRRGIPPDNRVLSKAVLYGDLGSDSEIVRDHAWHLATAYEMLIKGDEPSIPVVGGTFDIARDDFGPFEFSLYISSLAAVRTADCFDRWCFQGRSSSDAKLLCLLSMRRRNPKDDHLLSRFFAVPNQHVRRAAVQWVAEEGFKEFRPQVAAILNDPGITSDLFLATLAALEMLDGVPPQEFDKTPASKYVVPLLKDANRPPAVRVQALRLASPADPALDAKLLESLLASPDEPLRHETVRTLQASPVEQAASLLLSVVNSQSAPIPLKADALVSLSAHIRGQSGPTLRVGTPATESRATILAAFRSAAMSLDATLRREGLRALRGIGADDAETRKNLLSLADTLRLVNEPQPEHREIAEQLAMTFGEKAASLPKEVLALRPKRPSSVDEWKAALVTSNNTSPLPTGGEGPGVRGPRDAGRDSQGKSAVAPPPHPNPLPQGERGQAQAETALVAAGRRTFFHPNSAGCFKCHTVNGRGGNVGPDLSTIARSMSRDKLIESILEPSREVAPQFTTWTMETADGKVHSGMIVHENEGKTILGDADGKLTELKTIDIVGRTPQRQSVMPDKLADRLTVQEFRDLLAYLESLK